MVHPAAGLQPGRGGDASYELFHEELLPPLGGRSLPRHGGCFRAAGWRISSTVVFAGNMVFVGASSSRDGQRAAGADSRGAAEADHPPARLHRLRLSQMSIFQMRPRSKGRNIDVEITGPGSREADPEPWAGGSMFGVARPRCPEAQALPDSRRSTLGNPELHLKTDRRRASPSSA